MDIRSSRYWGLSFEYGSNDRYKNSFDEINVVRELVQNGLKGDILALAEALVEQG